MAKIGQAHQSQTENGAVAAGVQRREPAPCLLEGRIKAWSVRSNTISTKGLIARFISDLAYNVAGVVSLPAALRDGTFDCLGDRPDYPLGYE
jgi:hypothetical protein